MEASQVSQLLVVRAETFWPLVLMSSWFVCTIVVPFLAKEAKSRLGDNVSSLAAYSEAGRFTANALLALAIAGKFHDRILIDVSAIVDHNSINWIIFFLLLTSSAFSMSLWKLVAKWET
jgi:hypothetical protein